MSHTRAFKAIEEAFQNNDDVTGLRTGYRITLNLTDLHPEDVVEVLYDCDGLISRLEIFNLKDWAASRTKHIEAISRLQEVINEQNPIALKRIILEMIAAAEQAPRGRTNPPERIEKLVSRTERLARLRRSDVAARKLGVVLFGFPPNAGAAGTAAYLSVFESLFHTLHRLKAQGYSIEPPETVEALCHAVLEGNARQYGQEANVAAHVSADEIVAHMKKPGEAGAAEPDQGSKLIVP